MVFGFFVVVGKAGVNIVVIVEGGADEGSEGDAFVFLIHTELSRIDGSGARGRRRMRDKIGGVHWAPSSERKMTFVPAHKTHTALHPWPRGSNEFTVTEP